MTRRDHSLLSGEPGQVVNLTLTAQLPGVADAKAASGMDAATPLLHNSKRLMCLEIGQICPVGPRSGRLHHETPIEPHILRLLG